MRKVQPVTKQKRKLSLKKQTAGKTGREIKKYMKYPKST